MSTLLIWIVFIPFLSAALMGLVYLTGLRSNHLFYTVIGILAPLLSGLFSLFVGWELLGSPADVVLHVEAFQWIALGDFDIAVAFMADRLTAVMLFFITFIGTLIHIYAVGYMSDDEAYGKFFSFFNLFMGSMLLLVLADNPIIMFVGWELVGLSSYLLIGFYHQDAKNIKAANKAFMLNRVGDFGFIIALSVLFIALEGDAFTFESIKANIAFLDNSLIALVGMLLFVGAMGKSAQIPLYVWLPDAMAGPTPVSALIHAATMVTAGVYMVARFSFLYNEVPEVGEFIALIGALSALFAALIASYQSDIKKILAYSTMSQLGYMFIAVGLGAYSSGIFHVFTHAFFKALLFMGAGAVIVALHHEQNIFKMGGLRKHLGIVYVTMFIATLAISGIPPFAGFFSKDAILAAAFASGNYGIWMMATLTAMLTAYYMFRMLFIVFFANVHEYSNIPVLSRMMTWPLIVLAVGSAFAGLLGVNEAYGGSNGFASFIALPDTSHQLSHLAEYLLGFLNVLMALIGTGLAYKMFAVSAKAPIGDTFWKSLVMHKFYIDELYDHLIVRTLRMSSVLSDKVIDNKGVDGILHFSISGYKTAGLLFTRLQNGKVRYYALYILAGVAVMSLLMLDTMEAM